MPLTLRWLLTPRLEADYDNRQSHYLYLFARLNPGTGLDQAQSSINPAYRALLEETEAPLQHGLSEEAMQQFLSGQLQLSRGNRGQSNVPRMTRTPLLTVLGGAFLGCFSCWARG